MCLNTWWPFSFFLSFFLSFYSAPSLSFNLYLSITLTFLYCLHSLHSTSPFFLYFSLLTLLLIMNDLRYHPATYHCNHCLFSIPHRHIHTIFISRTLYHPHDHSHQPISCIPISLPDLSLSQHLFVINAAMIHLSGQKTNRNFITPGLKDIFSNIFFHSYFSFFILLNFLLFFF